MMKKIAVAAPLAALLAGCGGQGGGADANGAINNVAEAPADMSVLTDEFNSAAPAEIVENVTAAETQPTAKEEPEAAATNTARTREAAPPREKAAAPEKAPQRNETAPRQATTQRNQAAARPAPKQAPAPAPKETCTPEHREMGHC